MDFNLQKLEQKSIYILREARNKFKNIAVFCSMEKDSIVLLYLCKKAFFGRIPFSVVCTEDDLSKIDAFDALIVSKNQDFENASYVRIHPLLDWTKLDVQHYIKEKNIPVNQVIEKLKITQVPEGQGSVKDKEREDIIQRLKELGYL